MYPELDKGYRLWNMIIVSTLNSEDREETLIEFPFGEKEVSILGGKPFRDVGFQERWLVNSPFNQ